MPIQSSWKEETATLISRLSSKRAAAAAVAAGNAALVVQTGFPTSLADLVVKNRQRFALKKTKKSKPQRERNAVNPNPIPSPAVRSQSDGDRAAKVNATSATVITKERGLRLGFLAAGLGVLVVGRKWVVAGITILSLFLLVLELLGLFEKLKPEPRSEEEGVTVMDLAGRGLVSPIREESVPVVSDSGTDVSSKRSHLSDVVDADLGDLDDVLVKRKDFDENQCPENSKDAIKKKKKKQQLFKKIFGKKSNRKGEDLKENFPASAKEGENEKENCQTSDDKGEIEEEIVYENCHDDIETLNLGFSDGVAVANSEEVVETVSKNVDGIMLWRWRNLAFFAVLLLGLLGGKLVALMLILAWFLISEAVNRLVL